MTKATILVTGVTGFLGKVVLEELFRCREEYPFSKIVALIRPQEKLTAEERFYTNVASSLCFSRLPEDWTSFLEVVSADLSSERCGIEAANYDQICQQTTHIIHCAGSVAFSPAAAYETISDNITSTINIIRLAQSCLNLQRLVHTSTAYSTPYSDHPIEETISSHESVDSLCALLKQGKTPVKDLLASTGHPNLYTLAKFLAEHLLVRDMGALPVTIVRPSVISASWKYPFPGWIDSFAALAGLVASFGTGNLQVLNANPDTVLDAVPVDIVSSRLIQEALVPPSPDHKGARVVHVVSGINQGIRISHACSAVVDYFTRHPILHKPKIRHIGNKGTLHYKFHNAVHHQLPRAFARVYAKFRGDSLQLRRVEKVKAMETTANTLFEYFTQHTYDFRSATPCLGRDFDAAAYLRIVCQGVRVYLLQGDATKAIFAGRQARGMSGDFKWARRQLGAEVVTGVAAKAIKQTMTRIFDKATFNEHSFLGAIESMSNKGKTIVIVPTHRSYLDSVVCSYLFFTRPELQIRLPRILASREFSKIPVVGWLCRRFKTVFVVRGRGEPDGQLDAQLKELVQGCDNLLFFVEGQRSRTGEVLPGKRGVLRSLQATGTELVVLPVTITYDRIPEASAFAKEMDGGLKQLPTFKGLTRWAFDVLRGNVSLGNLHVNCGPPLLLKPDTDVHAFAEKLTVALSAEATAKS
ncbi:Fatty acyl-CoA reductase 1 [Paramyrothecium foliicola]|nr:Fatty acyl-CoA reductase 1 [Paramyrothecium foliicola]